MILTVAILGPDLSWPEQCYVDEVVCMIADDQAAEIAEKYLRENMVFRLEPVSDISSIQCYNADLSDYYVFRYTDDKKFIIGSSMYVAVHKKNGTVITFEY